MPIEGNLLSIKFYFNPDLNCCLISGAFSKFFWIEENMIASDLGYVKVIILKK